MGFQVVANEFRRTFPSASKAPSKKSNTPSMINIPPKEVRATPISVNRFRTMKVNHLSTVAPRQKEVWADSEYP